MTSYRLIDLTGGETTSLDKKPSASGTSVLPILMHRSDIITLKEAIYRTGKSDRTLRNWCKQFGIGRQTSPGAPLEISAPGLEMVLHGDFDALELLREGNRRDRRAYHYRRNKQRWKPWRWNFEWGLTHNRQFGHYRKHCLLVARWRRNI